MDINLALTGATLKKISNRKTSDHVGIHEFWSKKFMFIDDGLPLQLSKCLQVASKRVKRHQNRRTPKKHHLQQLED